MSAVLVQRMLTQPSFGHEHVLAPSTSNTLPSVPVAEQHSVLASMADSDGCPSSMIVQSAPIFAFPAEIITRIFAFLVDLDPPRSTPPQTRHRSSSVVDLRPRLRDRTNTLLANPVPSRLGWIRVTHTCQRWRYTALAYPALWDTIPFLLGERWAQLALGRAQSSELVIRHSFYPGTRGSGLLSRTDLLATELHRIRVLELGGAPETLGPVLAHLRVPAPRLQTLALQADRAFGPNEGWPFALPRGLFQNIAPVLCELSLDGCFPSAIPPDLPAVRHLSVCLRPMKRDFPQSRDVFRLLRCVSGLETLTLKNCLPQMESDGATSVEMPALQYIDLVDTDFAIAQFMHVISFPQTASLDVQCLMSSIPEDESARALSVIIPCIARACDPVSATFITDGRDIEISLTTPQSIERPEVHIIVVPSGSAVWDCPRLAAEAFGSIPGSRLTDVNLRFPVATPSAESDWRKLPDLWVASLGRFRGIRSVQTSRTLGWAVCAALVVDNGTTGGTLFPSLQTLTLVGVDLLHPRYWDGTLVSLVRARQGRLKRLSLIGCEYLGRETLIPELRTMVDVEVLEGRPEFVVF